MKNVVIGLVIIISSYGCTKEVPISVNSAANNRAPSVIDPININNAYDYHGQDLYNTYLNTNDYFSTLESNDTLEQTKLWLSYADSLFHENFEIDWDTNLLSERFDSIADSIGVWFIERDALSLGDWIEKGKNLENEITVTNNLTDEDKRALLMVISALKWDCYFWKTNNMRISSTVVINIEDPLPNSYASWKKCHRDAMNDAFSSGTNVIGFLLNFGGGPGGSVLAAAAGCAILELL